MQKYPAIKVTVFDTPAVVEEGREVNTEERVAFVGGMWTGSLFPNLSK